MRIGMSGSNWRVSVVVFLVGLAAPTLAAGPAAVTGPHGEGGKINRVNGVEFISYTYIAAPGIPGTPAVFKVFRPRPDPPDGLQKPRLLAGDVGSWAFIGEGNLAAISAMMDLDANGIVTWQFMSIANLEKYRPSMASATPAATPSASAPNNTVAEPASTERAPASVPATGPNQPPWRSLTDVFLWREDASGNPNQRWIQSNDLIFREGVNAQQLGPRDLMTKEEFGDFELEFKWKYVSGGATGFGESGGVAYRVTDEFARSFFSGPQFEFAVVPIQNRLQDASGGVRGLYPGKQGLQTDLPGKQWSTARIVVHGSHVEHWYNGTEVIEFDTDSAEWKARVKGSDFAKYPNFARAPKGRIAIDGYAVPTATIALSDIKIRVNDEPAPERYVFVDPDPPPVQSGPNALKTFQAACITDPRGPQKESYITAAFLVIAPRARADIEKSWLEYVAQKLPATDQRLGGRCWTTAGSQARARMMIENQVRQDALNGITDKPFSWAYVAQQPTTADLAQAALAPQAGENERVRQLMALDSQLAFEFGKVSEQAPSARGQAEIHEELGNWQIRRQKDCGVGLRRSSDRGAIQRWQAGIASDDAKFNCTVAKVRERIALYQKVRADLAAGKVAPETWAAIGVK